MIIVTGIFLGDIGDGGSRPGMGELVWASLGGRPLGGASYRGCSR